MPALPAEIDIAIVGAGAAGLGAAARLAGGRASVAVLEARDRIGGRAHTVVAEGLALDLGCGWLHSADENELAARAKTDGVAIDRTPPPWERPAMDHEFPAADQTAWGEAFAAFEERVAEAARAGDGRASDLLEPGGRWNGLIDAVSGALNGAWFEDVSIRDYDRYRDTGVNWRLPGGYGAFVAGLGGPAPVVTSCAVREIDRSGAGLKLTTSLGVVAAKAVILTAPTPVIAAEAIRITPAAPELIDAAHAVPLGLASKVHLALDGARDFAADSQVWGRTDTRETAAYHLRPFGRDTIEAYFGAGLAWGLEAEGEAAFVTFAEDQLVGLFGSSFRRRIRPLSVSMWGADPFARGAYSHALPGMADARARLARPIDDRLFVAGEATSEAFYGTAHGAWMEGERAADEALVAVGLRA